MSEVVKSARKRVESMVAMKAETLVFVKVDLTAESMENLSADNSVYM